MDKIKLILTVIGVLAVVVVGIWLIGIISALLWFALWIGLIAAIGYGGYKLFFAKEKPKKQLEEKSPIMISDLKETDRQLEEYKRKLLPK
jgi:hypothetical protein